MLHVMKDDFDESPEDILNPISGISWVDAQKERMTVIQEHMIILINLLNLLKKLLMFLFNLMKVTSNSFALFLELIDVLQFLLFLK